ncbi:L-cysteine:1D-myo-inositol 2-amino-2-deoxy-alpha-D-glucopyranoside ligase [Pseudoclavibacter endophyticus]|uniref:L-cysteine:1D-myo-inositol 2-amino-2-deoxy-alpha-D-glucopyranoside ligase n=1 Tax=Pseudoclavibacter endophyticus TaxID=1778590 RepID=A0A6H9WUL5_9MICO|nr:cysteine--1-D-myo-inosityl 2-amino-2-deoxy-alpha-D-glucopyranoside ligase [Pseudoclavibacter endophyticus]KAB1650184.1 cysteine--1-D-myo-inosityl 2-amino-2-deoxy-alpha-D-glucopyranoside ligase [Pseudoclavibacter endophyticus]GGA56399.1 L-cysteine:1D-myo-inositol 2-amino-2-deoxy-alpha-D-glucopyranoside ligase [Pseudoclavibacter endophyticus]
MKSVPSWPAPEVPEVAGPGVPVSLFNTATGVVEPVHPEEARLYVCGITPYDATHLGHAATYVAFDTLGRAWRDAGVPVLYAQNITDVDDPLLERAATSGRDWRDIAQEQTDLFREDMRALRIVPPDVYVRVQDVIDETADAVSRMLENGTAYRVAIGSDASPAPVDQHAADIYFDVRAAERLTPWTLGESSRYSPERMAESFREFGGDPDRDGKRDPYDPLLWRAARAGEPSWPTPVGAGRPGWHVECAVIATGTLGVTVTVQAGGRDLTFPHHELSAAHASAMTGEPFAKHYAHAGLVAYQGTKMSKSLGNLVLVSKLTADGHDPAAIRLAILRHHYRDDWEWSDTGLAAAEEQLRRWRAHANEVRDRAAADGTAASAAESTAEIDGIDPVDSPRVTQIRRAVANDLNTPLALAHVDGWAASGDHDPAVIDLVDALLGIRL